MARRVRLAMYTVRVMLALTVAGLGLNMLRLEDARRAGLNPLLTPSQLAVEARHSESMQANVVMSAGGLIALLALLCLGAVEPTVRAVRRHEQRMAEQGLQLRRLALAAEYTAAMVIITDAEERLVWANAAFTRLSGWPLEDVLGRRPAELLRNPAGDPAVATRVRAALAAGSEAREDWLARTRDGRDLWLDLDLHPLRDEAGTLSGFVSVNADVTARVLQQAKVQALWAALPAGVVVHGADGSVIDANRAAEQLLGLSLAQLRDYDPADARWVTLDADENPNSRHSQPAMRTLASGQPLRNQTLGVRLRSGELRWLLVNTEPQRDALGQITGVVACFNDITESRKLQSILHSSARTDALTKLPNRAVVMERLVRAVDHARRHPGYGFAVLFMDFDRFKQVNDTMGHGAGDELLRQIAQRLQLSLRPGDAVARVETETTVAARLGGDEFVVVLEGVPDEATVQAVAVRLLQEVSEPYVIGNLPVQSSASIGVVLCTQASLDPELPADTLAEDVLRDADTAMYEAKRAGRGRWVMFDSSMHERVVRALALETDLRRALKADELFVVYQPVMDLATRRMAAVEALVRWRHPQRGLVNPADFITVAEEAGLIDAVGEVVLNKACAQFVQWRRTLGRHCPEQVAVNLSRAQLARATLADDVRAVLQATGMRPEHLQLEVTESLAAQDERVQVTLRELKALGVSLSLDDFGTGYSSLACLHQMPVDTVKVDRSFVQHAETVEYHRVLIEATIRVARTLGMTTVAEGIETEGQADLMGALSCDRGQGFLFARPLDAEALESWLREQASAEREPEAADTL